MEAGGGAAGPDLGTSESKTSSLSCLSLEAREAHGTKPAFPTPVPLHPDSGLGSVLSVSISRRLTKRGGSLHGRLLAAVMSQHLSQAGD